MAILLVLGIHAPLKVLESGYVGVTVFFCLSGYLITGLLLKELAATGRLELRAFYRRRAARLFPGLIVALVVTAAIAWWVTPVESIREALVPPALALTYLMNLPLALGMHLGPHETFYSWTWSLALEEQFYLLWPLILARAARRGACSSAWWWR